MTFYSKTEIFGIRWGKIINNDFIIEFEEKFDFMNENAKYMEQIIYEISLLDDSYIFYVYKSYINTFEKKENNYIWVKVKREFINNIY